MAEDSSRKARIASVVAATSIALACGTNYAYSAWSPEFGSHMRISATESNLIGVAGNLGMYAMGIPVGIFVDSKGPQFGVALGALALACGYFPIYQAYVWGPDSVPIALIRFCTFLTGLGSCTSFTSAIKTSTFNWPDSRGTATAFPISGFGLSAFFFATLANFVFGEDIAGLLLMLSIGCLVLQLIALPFIHLVPPAQTYTPVPSHDGTQPRMVRSRSYTRPRSKTGESQRSTSLSLEGERTLLPGSTLSLLSNSEEDGYFPERGSRREATPLLQDASEDDLRPQEAHSSGNEEQDSLRNVEITGFTLLREPEFWQLFALFGVLAGIGLMTINNIGNNTKALWRRFDAHVTPSFLQSREQLHVSILSLGSFCGRLLSGIGSDYLVKRLNASRFWCITASALIFIFAQAIAARLRDPRYLWLVSSSTGLGYGALFGVFPALVADAFGITGFSLNWGFMIFAPVVSSYCFNYWYGMVYDDHSHILNDGTSDCPDGIDCFQLAYNVTFIASLVGFAGSLWYIILERRRKAFALSKEVMREE